MTISTIRNFTDKHIVSETGPYEGTLLVNPLLNKATAYFLLRPFFKAKQPAPLTPTETFPSSFLEPSNWELDTTPNSWLHGATPGHGQELRPVLHPHLDLPNTMVHMPRVQPGDYVSWHCDTIHAVDSVHAGKSDSSVMYIPACPLTVANAEFVARERECFSNGQPCPDFGGGKGEAEHIGRPRAEDVRMAGGVEGMRATGLMRWDLEEPGLGKGEKEVMMRANEILGF